MPQLLRYCLVGGVNTGAHFVVLLALVEGLRWTPLLANGVAFVAASTLSFQLNARFTFASPARWDRYARFVLIASLGLAINSAALYGAGQLGWHYLPGAVLGILASVVVSYALHKKLVFGS